jgi:hypothetical protein
MLVWFVLLTTRARLSPIRSGFAPGFVNYKKGCTRLAATSDKAYQLLAHGWLFSPGFATGNGEVLLHIPNTEPIFWPASVIIIYHHQNCSHPVLSIHIATWWFSDIFTVNATVAVDGQGWDRFRYISLY